MAKNKSMSNEKLLQEILKSNDETKRHFEVVVERLEKQISAIAEQHGSVMGKLEEHDKRFDSIVKNQEEIKSVKSELVKINQKLDTKLENHEEQICDIEHKVSIA